MQKFTASKRATEKLDYIIDWSDWLAVGETISASAWIVDTGVTDSDDSNTTTTATVFIAGGTETEAYKLTNTITTSNAVARTGVREITLSILDT